MKRLALWRLERRLARVARRYQRGDVSAVAEYIETLAQARALWLGNAPRGKKNVHLGAGGHHIQSWINVDVLPAGVDVLADFQHHLPFRAGSVDLVHSEDLIEHLELPMGKALVRECHRILKPGGVMRIVTPDLRALIQRVYIDRAEEDLAWCNTWLKANGPCEALNMHMRMEGEHRFVYDEEYLRHVLEEAGFRVRRVHYNASPVRELRYLDLRNFGLSIFLEAVKGDAS